MTATSPPSRSPEGTAPVGDTAVFEIYIKATPERIWEAITDPAQRAKFSFGVQTHSDWAAGSTYRAGVPGVVDIAEGENLVVEPPRLLVQTFKALWSDEVKAQGTTRVTWEIEPVGDSCRLTVVHDRLPGERERRAVRRLADDPLRPQDAAGDRRAAHHPRLAHVRRGLSGAGYAGAWRPRRRVRGAGTPAHARRSAMTRYGYTLMTEQSGPKELVRYAAAAEQAGFDFEVMSDHYFPWLDEQGHAGYAWSMLGAVTQVTERVELMTYVTCPIMRYHPAVVAQKAATVGVLSDGRFMLGLGAGENLNEHVVGRGWPPVNVRHEMLEEAVRIIRALLAGGDVSTAGRHFRVDSAKVWDLPETGGADRGGRLRCPVGGDLRPARRPPRGGRTTS